MSRTFELLQPTDPNNPVEIVRAAGRSPLTSFQRRWQAPPVPESDSRRFLGILQRRWPGALIVASSVMGFALIATLMITPMYKPTATVQINPPGSEVFAMERAVMDSPATDYVGSQIENLGSDQVALSVIRQLGLDKDPHLTKRPVYASLTSWLRHNVSGAESAPKAVGLRNDEALLLSGAENRALKNFDDRLTVTRRGDSRIVSVSFAHEDPHRAAQITNAVVAAYLDQYTQRRLASIRESERLAKAQLEDVRAQLDTSKRVLTNYQKRSGIADIGDKQSTWTQKAADLNQELTKAQTDKIHYESFLNRARLQGPDSLPQVQESPLVQGLKQRLAEQQAALANTLAVYGPNHPAAMKLRQQVINLQESLNTETRRTLTAIQTQFKAAQSRESMLAGQVKGILGELNQMAEYVQLRKDYQASSDLHQALYQRVKEAGVAAATRPSNIEPIQVARVLDQPSSPRTMLNLAAGLFFGLLCGAGFAFFREVMDETVTTPEEVMHWTGLPSIGVVPRYEINGIEQSRFGDVRLLMGKSSSGEKRDLFMLDRPKSPQAEAIRSIRTSILLAPRPNKVVLVVSPALGEGKTTIAANLAVSLAEKGPTCLVDADVRHPSIAAMFHADDSKGLVDVLRGQEQAEQVLFRYRSVPGLAVMAGGPSTEGSEELILSEQMRTLLTQLRKKFNFVVIDSAPLLAYADARALSVIVDGLVLVGRPGVTTRQELARSAEVISDLKAPVFGIVLNGVDLRLAGYRSYKYYRQAA